MRLDLIMFNTEEKKSKFWVCMFPYYAINSVSFK